SSDVPVLDHRQDAFNDFSGQVPQEIAFCQQGNECLLLLLLALQRIFTKPVGQADGRALAVEIQRGDVVDNCSDGEAAADKGPSLSREETSDAQFLCALVGKIDGQSTDQRAGGESKDAGEDAFSNGGIESDGGTHDGGNRGCKADQGHFEDGDEFAHLVD